MTSVTEAGNRLIEVMKEINGSEPGSGSPIPLAEIILLRHLLHQAEEFDEHRIRVGVTGEVKAGKSSLINALVGRDVVPTDILEMTGWITHVIPAEDGEYCDVELEDGLAVHHDPARFFDDCKNRRLSEEQIGGIRRVRLGCSTGLPFVLVDAPGMGSTTRENEGLMLSAVGDLDMALWVVDATAVGSIRDTVFIGSLRKQGLPVWCCVTKCDRLDSPDELDEVIDWLVQKAALPSDRVYPVSALEATRGTTDGVAGNGLARLRQDLCATVCENRASIRRDARVSRETRFRDEAVRVGTEALVRFRTALEAFQRYRDFVLGMAESVSSQTEAIIEYQVREKFLSEYQLEIAEALKRECKTSGLNDAAISAAFRQTGSPDFPHEFWKQLEMKVKSASVQFWQDGAVELGEQVEEVIRGMEFSAAQDVRSLFDPATMGLAIAERSDHVYGKVLRTGLMAAAGATAWAAWFGPGAAAVSLGAAATGIGIPVAVVAGVAAGVAAHFARNQARSQVENFAAEAVVGMRQNFIDTVLKPHVFPALREANRDLAANLIERFSKDLDVHVSHERLPQYVNDLETRLDELQRPSDRLRA